LNSKSTDKKSKSEKVNSRAIYAYAIALFALVVASSQKSLGVVLDWPQMIGLGFVLVLLLYRYFDFIKLGGFLELEKRFEDSEKQLAIAQNEINDLTDPELLEEESKDEKKSEAPKEDFKESKKSEEKSSTEKSIIKNLEDTTLDQPTEEQSKHCMRLLKDRKWRWRTDKTLMRRTKMNKKQFSRFLDDHPEVIESYIDDVSGNKLYKLED